MQVPINLFKSGGGFPKATDVGFVDENGSVFYFNTDKSKELDTLVVSPVDAKYLELVFGHNSINNLYFYVKAGDTVLVTYDDHKYPVLKSYSSEQLTKQYNFRKDIPSRLSYFGVEPLSIFSSSVLWMLYGETLKETNWVKDEVFLIPQMDAVEQQVISYLKEYSDVLEKEYSDKTLSLETYRYHRYMLQYKHLMYEIAKQENKYKDSFSVVKLERMFDDFFCDELLGYYSYQNMLFRFRWLYTRLEGFDISSKNLGGSDGSWYDFCAVFDSFSVKTYLPPKTRNQILYRLFDDITAHFSVEDVLRYKKRYTELTGDSIGAENKLIERGIIQPVAKPH